MTPGRAGAAVALVLLAAGCERALKPGDPLRGLNRAERDRFAQGKVIFDSNFTPETGLGPLFNSTGCGECHEDPAKGGTGDEVEVTRVRHPCLRRSRRQEPRRHLGPAQPLY